MSVTLETGTTLAFDRFWRWLKQHANCLQRAGSSDVYLYDQEAFHWHLDEDADRNPLVQLVWGKNPVGEIALDVRDVLFVQAMPDPEAPQPGPFLFEVIGGGREEPYAVYHFVVAHGVDEEGAHAAGGLKH